MKTEEVIVGNYVRHKYFGVLLVVGYFREEDRKVFLGVKKTSMTSYNFMAHEVVPATREEFEK